MNSVGCLSSIAMADNAANDVVVIYRTRCIMATSRFNNLAALRSMNVMHLVRGMLWIGFSAIWLLTLVCYWTRVMTSPMHYIGYQNFIKQEGTRAMCSSPENDRL